MYHCSYHRWSQFWNCRMGCHHLCIVWRSRKRVDHLCAFTQKGLAHPFHHPLHFVSGLFWPPFLPCQSALNGSEIFPKTLDISTLDVQIVPIFLLCQHQYFSLEYGLCGPKPICGRLSWRKYDGQMVFQMEKCQLYWPYLGLILWWDFLQVWVNKNLHPNSLAFQA